VQGPDLWHGPDRPQALQARQAPDARPGPAAEHPTEPGRRHLAAPSIRSAERRRWCADLLGPDVAGLVLHGAGGIGKSALAEEIVARAVQLEPDRRTVLFRGEVSADRFLARLASALRRHPVAASWGGARALVSAGRTDLSWAHRLELFRDHVLRQVPVLVVLDDFDDNLSAGAATPAVEDPALAGLLASLAGAPGLAKLLITCRAPVRLPGRALGHRCVDPLSASGAAGLAAALPALSLLDEPDIDQAWRLTGGHPRVMEYLDALLAGDQASFAEVAERLDSAIRASTGQAVLRTGAGPAGGGSPASPAAGKIAVAAGDVLLGELSARLSPDAHDLLTGASVYREPVGTHVLLLPAGRPRQAAGLTGLVADCVAAGLLTADYSGELPSVFVHRWTAGQLHRRLVRERRGEEVADAHRRAAEYWRWRISSWPHDRHALHEASYHLLRAGDHDRRGRPGAGLGSRRLLVLGAAAVAVAVAAGGTAAVTGAFRGSAPAPGRAAANAGAPAGSAAGTLAARSAAIRDQAAAWVARQVSGDAIVACDPAMYTALQAHGIPPGNLLMLRPSSGDPLGSDLVMATPAVRSQFGGRLASVYAPVIIASFGSGDLRIDVRAVAPYGAAAYRVALAADLAARRAAGRELLRNSRIGFSAAARGDLVAGRVDSRLLLTLAAAVWVEPMRVVAFTDSGPRAAPGVPLRAAELAVPPRAGSTASTGAGAAPGAALRKLLAFVREQRPPYRPARAVIVRGPAGGPALIVQFGAPSIAGLINDQPMLGRDPQQGPP